MARGTPVPITPSVLSWAIRESGHSVQEVAKALKVSPETLYAWQSGSERPNVTHFRALAKKLKRTAATLLSPEPPKYSIPSLEFRHPPGEERTSLNPLELRYIRETSRIQRILAWVLREIDAKPSSLPRLATTSSIEKAASEARHRLNLSIGKIGDSPGF